MPWLLVAGDNRLQVLSEVRIECDRGVALLRVPEDLRDGPSAPVRCANHRRGTMVVLHDHFDAFRTWASTAWMSRASSASVMRTVAIASIIAYVPTRCPVRSPAPPTAPA